MHAVEYIINSCFWDTQSFFILVPAEQGISFALTFLSSCVMYTLIIIFFFFTVSRHFSQPVDISNYHQMAALLVWDKKQAMHSIKSSGTHASRALEGVWHGMKDESYKMCLLHKAYKTR